MSTIFTRQDFYVVYYEQLGNKENKSYQDAYLAAEEIYKKKTGTAKNKFSTYAVFRALLSRDLRIERM
jgi:hypothetical protein